MEEARTSGVPGARDMAQIVIYIDTIDDIFSDFDPRKIEVRVISVDLINEMRLQGRQSKNNGEIEVRILAPRAIKHTELPPRAQKITRRRIQQYFEDEYQRLRSDRRKYIARALLYLVSGLTCFFIIKLAGDPGQRHLVVKISLELITFFSWFATWKGIDTFGNLPKNRDVRLLRRLAEAQIQFQFVKDITAIKPV